MYEQSPAGSDDSPVRHPFPYRKVLGPEWLRLTGIAATATAAAGLMVFDPFVVRMVLSSFGSWSSLVGALAAFAGLRGMQEGVQFTFGVLARSAGQRVRKRLVDDAEQNVVGLQRDQLSDEQLLQAVNQQADKVQQSISSAGTVLFSVLRMMGGIAGAVAMAGLIAALPFVLGGMGMTAVMVLAAKHSGKLAAQVEKVTVKVNELVRDRIGGKGRSLRRQYGAIDRSLDEVFEAQKEQGRLTRKEGWINDLMERVGNVVWHYGIMVPYFLVMSSHGGITPTMIALFDQGMNVVEGMKRIGPALRDMPAGMHGVRRLVGLQAMEPRVRPVIGGKNIGDFDLSRPALELEGVSFDGGGHLVLDGVHLKLGQGELVVVMGESGGGKSTLLDLIARGEREPSAGTIFIHGVSLSRVDSKLLARVIGRVDQHPTFVEGTIRDNLLIAKSDADEQHLRDALYTVGLHVSLDKVIGSDGTGISGGQRGRLAIARCLLHDPLILLWDEPTAALDKDGARDIGRLLCQIVVDSRRRGRPISVLMVTHGDFRYPVDRTFVVRDGKLLPQNVYFDVPANVPTAETVALVTSMTGARLKPMSPLIKDIVSVPLIRALLSGVLVSPDSLREPSPLACEPGRRVNSQMEARSMWIDHVRGAHPLTPVELFRLMSDQKTAETAMKVQRRALEAQQTGSQQRAFTNDEIDEYLALVKGKKFGDVWTVQRELDARGLVVIETDELRGAVFADGRSASDAAETLTSRMLTKLGTAYAACELLGALSIDDFVVQLPRVYSLVKASHRDGSSRAPVEQRVARDEHLRM